MSIGNAIVNQALGAANRAATGGLKKVLGNLPGSALGGGGGAATSFKGISTTQTSMNLAYPLAVEQDEMEGHYIMFFINSADPAKVKKVKADKEAAEFRSGFLGQDQLDKPTSSTLSSAPKGALAVTRPATVRLSKAISLYMPPAIKVQYQSLYKEEEIGAGAQLGAAAVSKAMDTAANQGISGFNPLKANWSAGLSATGDAGLALAASFAKGLEATAGPLVGLQGSFGAMSIQSGQVLSNKMELLFTGVERRKFSYTFTFIPKSEAESKVVADIVFTFKKHMTPEFGSLFGKGLQGRVLKIPETFDIQYMYKGKENPWINKISSCYLTDLDVQYGSDKAGFYEPLENPQLGTVGPPPTHTTLTLNFSEIEKMSRERIEQGF